MPPATQSPIRRSPLHHWHEAHGARFVESDGWLLPRAYGSPSDEANAARNGIGLADISALAKCSLRGRGVPTLASTLGIAALRSVRRVGRLFEAHHSVGLEDSTHPTKPGVEERQDDSIMACRLMEESLVLLSATTRLAESIPSFLTAPDILQTDITCAYAGLAVVGRNAESLVRRVTAFDVAVGALAPGSCAETNLADVQALLVRPPAGLVDEISVYVVWDVGEYVWERLCGAGGDLGLTPIGTEALDILHTAKS